MSPTLVHSMLSFVCTVRTYVHTSIHRGQLNESLILHAITSIMCAYMVLSHSVSSFHRASICSKVRPCLSDADRLEGGGNNGHALKLGTKEPPHRATYALLLTLALQCSTLT